MFNLNTRRKAIAEAEKAGGQLVGQPTSRPQGPYSVNRRMVLRDIAKWTAGIFALPIATAGEAQANWNGHWTWSPYRDSRVTRWWETSAFQFNDWRWSWYDVTTVPNRFPYYAAGNYNLSFYWYERVERTYVRWVDPYHNYGFYYGGCYRYW